MNATSLPSAKVYRAGASQKVLRLENQPLTVEGDETGIVLRHNLRAAVGGATEVATEVPPDDYRGLLVAMLNSCQTQTDAETLAGLFSEFALRAEFEADDLAGGTTLRAV